MAARQHGAKAMIVVTGPRSPNAGELVPMTLRHRARRLRHRRRQHHRRRRERDLRSAPGQDARGRRRRRSTRGNPHVAGFALPGRHGHGARRRSMRETADRPQRRRLPAGDDAGRRRGEAVGRARRALRSPRPRRSGQLARRQGRRRQDPSRRRRQRVGTAAVLARRRRRSRSSRAAATCWSAFWSGEELGLIGSSAFVTQAAGAARPDRRLPELRHGRPHAGQQADRAGDRHQPGVGRDARAGERRGRLRSAWCSRIRISRPTSRPSTPPACRA